MSSDEILFTRTHVIVKERSSQSETKASALEDVNGTLSLLKNERGKFVRFVPLGLEGTMNDDWALINGTHSVVSSQDEKDSNSNSSNARMKFRFNFNLNDLRSVRRQHMLHGIAHMVFILKDGTTFPAFHFQRGGSKELLQILAQYLQLEKSAQDQRLYIVKDEEFENNNSAPVSIFDQLNLFDSTADPLKRSKGVDVRRTAIQQFSKVTRIVKDTLLGPTDSIPSNECLSAVSAPIDAASLLESVNDELRETNNDGFEVIYQVDFKKSPDVSRGQPLTNKDWQSSFDREGRLIDVDKIKETIFRGGIESNALRREVWKFLLNFYPWTSTRDERNELNRKRKEDYLSMKLQWTSVGEQQILRNGLFRDRKSLIDKDVARTDRNLDYFSGENNRNLVLLHDILMTYVMYNADLGYVQGMNDLLSPLVVVMGDEIDAFWCFAGLMDRMEQNFHMDQSHIKEQLGNLYTLLQFIDAELAKYLMDNNANNMYFFFRWMLICFKREFTFDDVMHLWEVIWTDNLCNNFELLICLAILISQKTLIMESRFGCTEILKFFNDLSCNLDLDTCLLSAEKLYIQLATHRDIPSSIVKILGLSSRSKQKLTRKSDTDSFARKVYTEQPRGTMNLDNSYFRQESEPSLTTF